MRPLIGLFLASAGGSVGTQGWPAAAHAQEVLPSPSPGPAPAAPGESTAGWVLLFGTAALILLYVYLHAWRATWSRMADRTLETTGAIAESRDVHSEIEVSKGGAQGLRTEKIAIRGPARVIVGQASAPFTVTIDDQPAPAETWKVEDIPATLDAVVGPQTRVTAENAGAFRLTATVKGKQVGVPVMAAPAEPALPRTGSSVGRLPLVGAGYGALTIGIVSVTIAGALTAMGALPGAALAALLGTVVSYFFVQRATGQSEGANPSQQTRGSDAGQL